MFFQRTKTIKSDCFISWLTMIYSFIVFDTSWFDKLAYIISGNCLVLLVFNEKIQLSPHSNLILSNCYLLSLLQQPGPNTPGSIFIPHLVKNCPEIR